MAEQVGTEPTQSTLPIASWGMMERMQPVDYLDAHERHWEDAELLLGHQRTANADQLFGMSAECGLKHVMESAGYLVLAAGMPQHKMDRAHADAYWTRYVTLASGKGVPLLHTHNPFADWSVHQRYAPRTAVTATAVAAHRGGAATVRALVRTHRMSGGSP